MLNSSNLSAFWDQQLALKHLKEKEVCFSGVAARFTTKGEDGNIWLLAVGLEVVDVTCKQACTKDDKAGAKLFVEGNVVKE